MGLGCGGADKWTVEPAGSAFPGTKWDAGSGSIYCDPGFFCPNSTSKACPCNAFTNSAQSGNFNHAAENVAWRGGDIAQIRTH